MSSACEPQVGTDFAKADYEVFVLEYRAIGRS
jgi:hypothetical protein